MELGGVGMEAAKVFLFSPHLGASEGKQRQPGALKNKIFHALPAHAIKNWPRGASLKTIAPQVFLYWAFPTQAHAA